MFLRFTKRNGKADRVYRRAVFLNNSILVQHGDSIVAFAYLKAAEGSTGHYVIEVATDAAADCAEVSRYVKRFISNARKWEGTGFDRRRYEVKEVGRLDLDGFSIRKGAAQITPSHQQIIK